MLGFSKVLLNVLLMLSW